MKNMKTNKMKQKNEMELVKNTNEFREAVKPLMEYLKKNWHPHTTVIVSANDAELVEGTLSVTFDVEDDKFDID